MTESAYLFPSPEWIDAFCYRLKAHPEATSTATALSGVYRFVVEPAGPLLETHRYDVAIDSVGDEPSITRIAGNSDATRLSLTADYVRWRELLEGRLDVKVAVLLRRLRVSGDLAGVRANLNQTRPLLEALSAVPTRWRN